MQNIQYCASGILIVHCTGERANYLKDQFDNNNEEIMRIMLQELRLAHGFQGDDNSKIKDLNVTDTAEVLYKYWEDGTYTWGKDSDASTTMAPAPSPKRTHVVLSSQFSIRENVSAPTTSAHRLAPVATYR